MLGEVNLEFDVQEDVEDAVVVVGMVVSSVMFVTSVFRYPLSETTSLNLFVYTV